MKLVVREDVRSRWIRWNREFSPTYYCRATGEWAKRVGGPLWAIQDSWHRIVLEDAKSVGGLMKRAR
ncbi:hypothetical protein FHS27_002724 [Rhodopirellula rubra]|uniref:Uncharacterized protein n=1 Tax=Aporhodopirellula rubra TaxID=980271 RepID=A0A7W5DYL4_9BACT|nr:hypothetical protein [Aporhodopirellula rubra]